MPLGVLAILILGQGFFAFIDKPIQDRLGMSRLFWGAILNPLVVGAFLVILEVTTKSIFPIRVDPLGVLLVFVLTIFHGISVVLYIELVRDESISYVVPATSIFPVITTLLGVFVLKEALTFVKASAVIGAIAGVYLLSTTVKRGGRLSFQTIRSTAILIIIAGISAFLDKLIVLRLGVMSRLTWGYVFWTLVIPLVLFWHPATRAILPKQWLRFTAFWNEIFKWGFTLPFTLLFGLHRQNALPPLYWDGKGMLWLVVKITMAQILGIGFWWLLSRTPVSSITPALATFPAVTAFLARIFLKEPLPPRKMIAIALAVGSVVMLSRL